MAGGGGLRPKLSRLLLAWTIEFDNAFEQALLATWARPFLTSATMWANVMQHVPASGIRVSDLAGRGRIQQKSLTSILGGMERWSYVTIDHDPAEGHPGRREGFGTARGLKAATVVYPSMVGTIAKGIWQPLAAEIDQRWRHRDGDRVDRLEEALTPIANAVGGGLPAFLPVLNASGLFSGPVLVDQPAGDPPVALGLSTALARVLLALTLEIERDAQLSLPVSGNLLRVLVAEATPVRDLPLATGLSKEAVSLALGLLEKQSAARVVPSPDGPGKVATITADGAQLRQELAARAGAVEADWAGRLGHSFDALSEAVDAVHDDHFLRPALAPPPTGWRASKGYAARTAAFVDRPTGALPHQPMVLHRGGWPDGS